MEDLIKQIDAVIASLDAQSPRIKGKATLRYHRAVGDLYFLRGYLSPLTSHLDAASPSRAALEAPQPDASAEESAGNCVSPFPCGLTPPEDSAQP